jgi:2-methylcitrate dehydratase
MHVVPQHCLDDIARALTGMRAAYAALLAKRGFTGPRGLFEGPKGLEQVLGQTISANYRARAPWQL